MAEVVFVGGGASVRSVYPRRALSAALSYQPTCKISAKLDNPRLSYIIGLGHRPPSWMPEDVHGPLHTLQDS